MDKIEGKQCTTAQKETEEQFPKRDCKEALLMMLLRIMIFPLAEKKKFGKSSPMKVWSDLNAMESRISSDSPGQCKTINF